MMSPDPAPKDIGFYSWLTYLWVVVFSAWGGLVSYWQNVKSGHARPFNIAELIGELVTSAFVGMMTFYLCKWAGMSDVITAPMVGICGHMGSRALSMLEKWAVSRFPGVEKFYKPPVDEHETLKDHPDGR